ncbi:tyrosine phosphatase [Xylariaceae sp. FL0016]|nr:tyrosine phosphatase [Xylariaceae sp. FL0016]
MSRDSRPSSSFVRVNGVHNARDIGGYFLNPESDKVVRRGLIFRSGEPSHLTPKGIDALRQLGVTTVYDLRSHDEVEKTGVKEWDHAVRVFAPVFMQEDFSPEATALRNGNFAKGPKGFVPVYQRILAAGSSRDNEARPFARILSHLSSPSPTPILIHCSAGKDRTGVICALVLSLCGVNDEVVAHEYSFSNQGLESIRHLMVGSLTSTPLFRDDLQGAIEMTLSRSESMMGFLQAIRKRWGSTQNMVLQSGLLSPEELTMLRHNLVFVANRAAV